MKSVVKLATPLVLVFLTGCEAVKVPAAMGGSKADGTITMGFNVEQFEKPIVDWNNTKLEAARRCQAWGYKNAEPFGGQKTSCNAYNGYGNCVDAYISMDYQCLN